MFDLCYVLCSSLPCFYLSLRRQWTYDTWWAAMTPDREFPAELRRIINAIFGEVCVRARRLDAKSLIIRCGTLTPWAMATGCDGQNVRVHVCMACCTPELHLQVRARLSNRHGWQRG